MLALKWKVNKTQQVQPYMCMFVQLVKIMRFYPFYIMKPL